MVFSACVGCWKNVILTSAMLKCINIYYQNCNSNQWHHIQQFLTYEHLRLITLICWNELTDSILHRVSSRVCGRGTVFVVVVVVVVCVRARLCLWLCQSVCVSLSVRLCVSVCLGYNFWSSWHRNFILVWWYILTISRSSSSVKVIGSKSRSHIEKCLNIFG